MHEIKSALLFYSEAKLIFYSVGCHIFMGKAVRSSFMSSGRAGEYSLGLGGCLASARNKCTYKARGN